LAPRLLDALVTAPLLRASALRARSHRYGSRACSWRINGSGWCGEMTELTGRRAGLAPPPRGGEPSASPNSPTKNRCSSTSTLGHRPAPPKPCHLDETLRVPPAKGNRGGPASARVQVPRTSSPDGSSVHDSLVRQLVRPQGQLTKLRSVRPGGATRNTRQHVGSTTAGLPASTPVVPPASARRPRVHLRADPSVALHPWLPPFTCISRARSDACLRRPHSLPYSVRCGRMHRWLGIGALPGRCLPGDGPGRSVPRCTWPGPRVRQHAARTPCLTSALATTLHVHL